MEPPEVSDMLTVTEAALELGVHNSTIRVWARRGLIKLDTSQKPARVSLAACRVTQKECAARNTWGTSFKGKFRL